MTDNASAIAGDQRLDSGMTAREAIDRASAWWDETGRKLMANVPGISIGERMRSALLRGEPWDALDKREKVRVVRSWHHFIVRRPDLLDVAPEARYKLGGEETVN